MEVLDFNIVFGKNATDNWRIYKAASQTSTIFHLDSFSSPYVIIDIPFVDLDKAQVIKAANLCKSKSKYKNIKNLVVFYTPISNTYLGNTVGTFFIKSSGKKKVISI